MKLLILFVLVPLSTAIAAPPKASKCEEAPAVCQVREAESALRLEERRLNTELKEFSVAMDNERRTALAKAHRAWLSHRAATCSLEVLMYRSGGGPYAGRDEIDCEIELTKKRISFLKELRKQREEIAGKGRN